MAAFPSPHDRNAADASRCAMRPIRSVGSAFVAWRTRTNVAQALLSIALAAVASGCAHAADLQRLAGRWVFTQTDGRGGAGCPMVLARPAVGARRSRIDFERDPAACSDALAAATSWAAPAPDTVVFYDAASRTVFRFTRRGDPENETFVDADGEFYIERLEDADPEH